MSDFQILKKFSISIHPPRAPQIKEVIWNPPLPTWTKGNTDGSANSLSSACGIIFRNCLSDCILCVAENIGTGDAFQAELCGAMRAIEIAHQRNWINFWLETDSKLVVMAFSNDSDVPWNLSNRWFNCKKLLFGMNFVISHIYREGNQCADSLANIGLSLQGLFVWETEFLVRLVKRSLECQALGLFLFEGFGLVPQFFFVFTFLLMKFRG